MNNKRPCARGSRVHALAEKVMLRNGEGLPRPSDPLRLAYWLASNLPFQYALSDRWTSLRLFLKCYLL